MEIVNQNGTTTRTESCNLTVTEDISLQVPESSLLSSHILNKAPADLPESFVSGGTEYSNTSHLGVAVDLGTTTIAGAFGSYLDKKDMLALGMLPDIDPSLIYSVGNAAGAGAIMALCDEQYIENTLKLAAKTSVIELAANIDFQNTFVERLSFPDPSSPS